jgi:hypothetical protein
LGGQAKGNPMNLAIPFRERISCTIPEACAATGLGRTKIYEEIGAGRVEIRKFGTRTLVVVDSLVALIHPGTAATLEKGPSLNGSDPEGPR